MRRPGARARWPRISQRRARARRTRSDGAELGCSVGVLAQYKAELEEEASEDDGGRGLERAASASLVAEAERLSLSTRAVRAAFSDG